MNKAQAELLVDRLVAGWPKEPMPAARRVLYLGCIADLPFELGEAVVLQALTTCKWMPTIAEFRALAADLCEKADGVPTVEEAWEEFRNAVRKYGSYRTPEWSHPAVARTANVIGYRDFCMSDVADTTIWRAQFQKAYLREREREVARMQMLPEVRRMVARLRMERPREPVELTAGEVAGG